jgi:hypothetical protein
VPVLTSVSSTGRIPQPQKGNTEAQDVVRTGAQITIATWANGI